MRYRLSFLIKEIETVTIKIMMGAAPAAVYAAKLQSGGVSAVAGTPLVVADGMVQSLPAQAGSVSYLVSAPVADAMAGSGRTDLYRLPPEASSNAPAAFGMDYLIQVI